MTLIQQRKKKLKKHALDSLGWCAILYINSLRLSMIELGSITERRLGLIRNSRTPGFRSTELIMGVPGRVRHRRPVGSLVPYTGGTGTVVLCFPAWAERGLGEERCTIVDETKGGGGQKREEKRDLDWSWSRSGSLFCCCESFVFSNKKFCLWFSLGGIPKAKAWRRWWWCWFSRCGISILRPGFHTVGFTWSRKHATSQCLKVTGTH